MRSHVCLLQGHLKNGHINLDWQELQDSTQTIVIYMGLTGLQQICEQLIVHGRDANTPAALIEHGTTATQRVVVGDLSSLPQRVQSASVSAPTLLIIGGVVSLRDKLAWFESSHVNAGQWQTPDPASR